MFLVEGQLFLGLGQVFLGIVFFFILRTSVFKDKCFQF